MKEIVVVGLGPSSIEQLTAGVYNLLSRENKIVFRTGRHPVVRELAERGICFTTFDHFYEEKGTFSEVYRDIAVALLEMFTQDAGLQRVIYGVPGHPLVAEESVQILLKDCHTQNVKVTIIPGMSFLDSLFASLRLDLAGGLLILDALDLKAAKLNPAVHAVFTQVYNRFVASDLKLFLLEFYPPEHPAVIVRAAGLAGDEWIHRGPLWELDHGDTFDHLTSVYLAPLEKTPPRAGEQYSLEPLFAVMDTLLSPQGCPWDREQDHFSLKPYLLEEAYEVLEAIDSGDMYKLKEELGDLLLQIVFHTALARQRDDFDFKGVVEEITEKMVRRHPHVFGDVKVNDSEDVLHNWEQIKAQERAGAGADKSGTAGIMDKVNRSLSALLLAEQVQKKAAKVGFDWPHAQGAWDKLAEEIRELKEVWEEDTNNVEDEIGDLLFSVVNISRFAHISPEAALLKANQKFIRRFRYIEDKLREKGLKWEQMDLHNLDSLWEDAKKREK